MASFDSTSHPGGRTQSVWQATATVPRFPALAEDTDADVCVIGAGIAGMSTAYMLAKAGKRVIVLDDGPVGGGATGRTTAHLSNAMDDRIYVLEKLHGAERTRYIVESHMAAIHRMEMIVQEESIDCDFRRLDGYLIAARPDGADVLTRELAAAHRAGMVDVRLVERAPIVAMNTGPALRFPEQGQMHALKYLAGLARAFVAMGGRIHCDTHVSSVSGGSPCTVETADKKKVSAAAVCACTNGSITDRVQTHAKQAPYRTFVIAMPVPRGSVDLALFWDTDSPYHYVRLQSMWASAPSSGNSVTYDLLIVGGEDHKTAHGDDAEHRWSALEAWTRVRWPQVGDVMYRWSGQVLEPADYVAFIGRNPDGAENVFMVSGDSGQGMTHGTIAGMLLTDLIVGRANPWEAVYDPKRITLGARSVEELVKENADVAVHYLRDHLTGGGDEARIANGEGQVIRQGLHKLAVYRDENGTLHRHSALCTHLKCVVAWNRTEKSWDCPCHGSRFDPFGAVINGPAIDPLGPAE